MEGDKIIRQGSHPWNDFMFTKDPEKGTFKITIPPTEPGGTAVLFHETYNLLEDAVKKKIKANLLVLG